MVSGTVSYFRSGDFEVNCRTRQPAGLRPELAALYRENVEDHVSETNGVSLHRYQVPVRYEES